MTTTTTSSRALLCSNYAFLSSNSKPLSAKSSLYLPQLRRPTPLQNIFSFCAKPFIPKEKVVKSRTLLCYASRRKPTVLSTSSDEEGDDNTRRMLQIALWVAEGIYVLWLFLLPYAPVSITLFQCWPDCLCADCLFVFRSFALFVWINESDKEEATKCECELCQLVLS